MGVTVRGSARVKAQTPSCASQTEGHGQISTYSIETFRGKGAHHCPMPREAGCHWGYCYSVHAPPWNMRIMMPGCTWHIIVHDISWHTCIPTSWCHDMPWTWITVGMLLVIDKSLVWSRYRSTNLQQLSLSTLITVNATNENRSTAEKNLQCIEDSSQSKYM